MVPSVWRTVLRCFSCCLIAAVGPAIGSAQQSGRTGELRLRSVDPWTGNMADFGFGVSRRID
jgi:hypothetical protein